MALASTVAAPHNPNKDIEVASPPTDGISSLSWSPKSNFLVATSWDNYVRCWEIQQTGTTIPRAQIQHEGPVLCSGWSADGTRVFSGGCDNKAKCWSIATGQSFQVAQHAAPIKCLYWVEDPTSLPFTGLVTGSWDKTIKYWDCRTAAPVADIDAKERVYAMDVAGQLMVVATAERQVIIYDIRKGNVEYRRITSPLKYQSRSLACFPDRTGFALGSIEGRVAIHHVEQKDAGKNFAFKCHRDNQDIYAVNTIAFHPVFGTFATAGSDGTFNFWDKDSKQRLKPFNRCSLPIPCGAFNMDGTIWAYAVSYDWSKGAEYYNPATMKNYILLHPVLEPEIKNRNATGAVRTNLKKR